MLRTCREGRPGIAECPALRVRVVALALLIAVWQAGHALAQAPWPPEAPVLQPATPSPAPAAGKTPAATLGAPVSDKAHGDAPASEKEEEAPSSNKQRVVLEAGWDYGLRFESADNQFHVHVGGNA
jgi:hypothetical protein